jgi:anthranilate phosphoribosyltransferase
MNAMQPAPADVPVTLIVSELLPKLVTGRDLTRLQAAQLVHAMLAVETPDAQIAAALALLVAKGECPDELAGFADALFERALPIDLSPDLLDTAGTGASRVKTFNVSTAAAFVIAAAGCAIAKHGARASTSRSGSADLLTALGVRIDCEPATSVRCLNELGICFLFAPKYHPALARVAPIRKVMGIRTTLNLVGPMVNPARARYRLLGVADQARMADVAGALSQLGVTRAWVLRGSDGLDEITTAGPTQILEVTANQVKPLFTISPRDFGLPESPTAAARAVSMEDNMEIVRAVLSGQGHGVRDNARDDLRINVARNLVVLNAAAALHVRTNDGLRECAARAQKAIDDGSALARLDALIAISNVADLAQDATHDVAPQPIPGESL